MWVCVPHTAPPAGGEGHPAGQVGVGGDGDGDRKGEGEGEGERKGEGGERCVDEDEYVSTESCRNVHDFMCIGDWRAVSAGMNI